MSNTIDVKVTHCITCPHGIPVKLSFLYAPWTDPSEYHRTACALIRNTEWRIDNTLDKIPMWCPYRSKDTAVEVVY